MRRDLLFLIRKLCFFEYAYCRRLLECREGYKDSFLFNYRLVVSSGPEEDEFEDSLKYFNVKEYTTTEKI